MAAQSADGTPIDLAENRQRMARGELYYAFTPDLIHDRKQCARASRRLNAAEDPTRRELVEMWKEYVRILSFNVAFALSCLCLYYSDDDSR